MKKLLKSIGIKGKFKLSKKNESGENSKHKVMFFR